MRYRAIYSDSKGSEHTFLDNDGKRLSIVIRGIKFSGTDFDSFEPELTGSPLVLSSFTLNHFGELCGCQIEFQVVLPLLVDTETTQGKFTFKIVFGDPAENEGIQNYGLYIKLNYLESEYIASSEGGYAADFETQLLALNRQLPASILPKCCFNCQYSDYSVFGQACFGSMMCFRNIKEEYSQVKTKADFMEIMDNFERWVQEIYLCSDFQKRNPGTGYRG